MNQGPILCVDDQPTNLALMRQVLGSDYKLVFARNGREAVEAALRLKPSLILMDVEMPEMNGLEAARALQEQTEGAEIPIIFVTSLNSDIDEEEGFKAGAVDYINKPISAAILKARVKTHVSLVRYSSLAQSYRSAISMLGEAGHYNDLDAGNHIWRMAAYSRLLAIAVGWSLEQAEMLEMAAPMHDMGKIGVPHDILKKPGPLDADEWRVMRLHTLYGYEILKKGQAPVFEVAAEIALFHHENWDGTGYPQNLAGNQIPETARIVAVADVFDALMSKRPYKEAWPIEKVIQTLQLSSDTRLEKRLVDKFIEILPQILAEKAIWDQRDVDALTNGESIVAQ